MALTPSEQLLLDALKAIPANSIYAEAEKKRVFRGFQLYTTGHVSHVGWKDGKGVLTITVEDRRPYLVTIVLDGSRPVLRCQCKAHLSVGKCEHIVCALLTVIHSLKPNLFRFTKDNRVYRERVLSGLLKESREDDDATYYDNGKVIPLESYRLPGSKSAARFRDEPAGYYRVILEKMSRGLECIVVSDGEDRGLPERDRLPPGLEYLKNMPHREDMSNAILMFLRGWGNKYPIFFRSRDGERPVEWLDKTLCETWTEIDTIDGTVFIRKTCTIGAEKTPALVAGKFAIDGEQGRLCYIGDTHGWEAWSALFQACQQDRGVMRNVRLEDDGTFTIPGDALRTVQFSFRHQDGGSSFPLLILKENGRVVQPPSLHPTEYRLFMTRKAADAAEYVVRHEPVADNHGFPPSRNIMSFVKTVEWGRIPVSVRTRKRKPLLYEAYFKALDGDEKSADRIIREIINETSFESPQWASLAHGIVKEHLAEARIREASLHLQNGRWHLFASDIGRESRIISMLYGIFGVRLFERVVNDIGMVIREDELLRHFNTLFSQATSEGVNLYLDGSLVEQTSWEFILDARSGTIDWFEIRPEILNKGQEIARELWEQALAGKGVVHSGGAVHILDEKTLETLSIIARLNRSGKGVGREIVAVPRLRIIDLFLLRKKGVSVQLSPYDEEIVARLTRFTTIEEKALPTGLKAELRPYQKEGYHWLAFLYEHGFGACLADDMGLGKTIQAICLLGGVKEGTITSHRAGSKGLFLVVVPPSLLFNWEQEIARFYPGLAVYVYRGRDRTINPDGVDVILTSYGLVLRDIEKLSEIPFRIIVFDEAQTVKNIFAGATGAVRRLKGFFKVVLTGTPIENHMGEYYSIMDLVLPGLLGDYREFQGKAKQNISTFLPEVVERTKPFVLRRTKEHILKELPPKVEHDLYLDLTDKQKAFYTRTVEEVRSTIDAAYNQKTAAQAKIIALTAIMKLRQICLTPELLVPSVKDLSPKIQFLKEKLDELQVESHSALVFSQFTSFLDIVEMSLRKEGFLLFRLDGSTPVSKRREIVEGFQGCSKPAVFLLSLKAGGQGLNLTRATYVFHLDPWWNPAVENQASDRTHRIGQKNKVIVTRLIMRHTVEEKMMALKERKQALFKALMETPEKSAGKAVTREDFNFLLGE